MNETRQSTEKRFSEAASENKKKRGRPTVYKRDHMEGIGRDLEIYADVNYILSLFFCQFFELCRTGSNVGRNISHDIV